MRYILSTRPLAEMQRQKYIADLTECRLTSERRKARRIASLLLADNAAKNIGQRLKRPIFVQVAP